MLGRLPERIWEALIECAAEIDYSIEAVIEMAFGFAMPSAIASFLDSEALGFADCKPGREQ
ncbi:MAG: hypothetical protein F6K30_07050 [Cyanothece sp. SIO2G6]|nr:hypothetical protein [Cyanothece sp. SIO2G6]